MREIKFRAWDKIHKDMKEVAIINWVSKFAALWNKRGNIRITIDRDFADIELMQYTGRKDKNGKEVYERDIILYEVWHGGIEHLLVEAEAEKQGKKIDWRMPFVIVFNKYGQFCMKSPKDLQNEDYGGYQIPKSDEIERIGNIYENPELLEGEQC